jgi:hypothetical protein
MSDALAYTYQQDGHAFYVLIFPSAETTWVYDAATGAWHERAGFAKGRFKRHRSNCHARFKGQPTVGDYQNGKLYQFDLRYFRDDEQEQRWMRRWRALPTGANNLTRTIHHQLQLDCQTGVGGLYDDPSFLAQQAPGLVLQQNNSSIIVEGEPNNSVPLPQVMLRWSDDGGHTWSHERWESLGPIGATQTRVIWRRLGATLKSRDRVYELTAADPMVTAIMGAELRLSPTAA